jgi:hypothetical protein
MLERREVETGKADRDPDSPSRQFTEQAQIDSQKIYDLL